MGNKNIIAQLLNAGVRSENNQYEDGKIRLVNLVSLTAFVILMIVVVVSLWNGLIGAALYAGLFGLLFLVPWVSNRQHNTEFSQLVFVFLVIAVTVFGTIVIGYSSFCKYAIIVPLILSTIYFKEKAKWKLIIAQSVISIYVIVLLIQHFKVLEPKTFLISSDAFYELVGYLAFLATIMAIQRFLVSTLLNSKKELMLFKEMYDSTSEAIAVVDEKGHYVMQNKAHKGLIGYSDAELKNHTPAVHLGKEAYARIEKTVKNKGVCHQEVVSKTKSGSKYLDLLLFPVDYTSNVQYHIGICRDITDRKQTEVAFLRNRIKLKEALASKDRFFSIIAHDLKSPFNSLIGFSELLLEDNQDDSFAEKKKALTHIHKISVQTYQLLENLLDWAQVESGSLQVNATKFVVKKVFESVIDQVSDIAAQKGIDVRFDAPEELELYADFRMIQVVLRNLVSNAIKFSHKNTTIDLRAERGDDSLNIAVIDQGVGMSDEMINDLFAVDNTSSSRGTDNEKGSGLGLILCKEFTEKNGGNLTVESRPGEGSTFTLTFRDK